MKVLRKNKSSGLKMYTMVKSGKLSDCKLSDSIFWMDAELTFPHGREIIRILFLPLRVGGGNALYFSDYGR